MLFWFLDKARREGVVGFGRCLLALGSRPRPPPPGFVGPAARGRVALLGARDGGADREALQGEVAAGGSVTIVYGSVGGVNLFSKLIGRFARGCTNVNLSGM